MARPALAQLPQPGALLGAGGLQQLMTGQEQQHGVDIVRAQLQRGVGIDRLQHRLGAAQLPVRQDFETGPAQLVEAVGAGIVQGPAGRAVGLHGPGCSVSS